MSVRKPAPDNLQPQEFKFSKDNLAEAKKLIAKYPEGRQKSAVISLLYLVQNQNNGWIPTVAMDEVAKMLEIPFIRVYEVASFYMMFNLHPIGKNHIQICTTTPCWLRGSDEIKQACKSKLSIDIGQTTKDSLFTISEVECLGACANAPMVQINNDYFEDLDAKSMAEIIDDLTKGKKIKPGSRNGRKCSAPLGERSTLKGNLVC